MGLILTLYMKETFGFDIKIDKNVYKQTQTYSKGITKLQIFDTFMFKYEEDAFFVILVSL